MLVRPPVGASQRGNHDCVRRSEKLRAAWLQRKLPVYLRSNAGDHPGVWLSASPALYWTTFQLEACKSGGPNRNRLDWRVRVPAEVRASRLTASRAIREFVLSRRPAVDIGATRSGSIFLISCRGLYRGRFQDHADWNLPKAAMWSLSPPSNTNDLFVIHPSSP